jgi:hypothetical protein
MPGFDGTGPRGLGPFTGGGRGYCALRLPNPESGEGVSGYVGIQGAPVSVVPRPDSQDTPTTFSLPLLPRLGRGRGGGWRGGRRGRGR